MPPRTLQPTGNFPHQVAPVGVQSHASTILSPQTTPSAPSKASAGPVQDLAFFEGLQTHDAFLSYYEQAQVTAAFAALDRGETPAAYLSQKDRDEQAIQLYQLMNSASTDAEKWRIAAHLEKLEAGENPGPFVAAHLVDGRITALETKIAAETDSAKIWALNEEIAALVAGVPFVSQEERGHQRIKLEAKLKAATSNDERYHLAEQINDLP